MIPVRVRFDEISSFESQNPRRWNCLWQVFKANEKLEYYSVNNNVFVTVVTLS